MRTDVVVKAAGGGRARGAVGNGRRGNGRCLGTSAAVDVTRWSLNLKRTNVLSTNHYRILHSRSGYVEGSSKVDRNTVFIFERLILKIQFLDDWKCYTSVPWVRMTSRVLSGH